MKRKLAVVISFVSVLAAAVVLFGVSLSPLATEAASNCKGKIGGTATIFANPDPSATNSYIRIQGSGYCTDTWVEVHIDHGTYTHVSPTGVWFDGGLIDMGFWTAEAGTYKLTGYQKIRNRQVLMSSGQMVVQ